MAYSTRSTRGSRDTRGRGRAPARAGGGGNNTVPIVVASVCVVVLVALVILLNSGKKEQPKPAPAMPPIETGAPAAKPPPPGPKPVVKGPLPALPNDLIVRARNLMPEIKEAGERAMALYDEGMKAKEAGDDATWQAKMNEGRDILNEAQAKWNAIEEEVLEFAKDRVPSGWANADEVAGALFDANLKAEAGIVNKSIDTPKQKMSKTGRGS